MLTRALCGWTGVKVRDGNQLLQQRGFSYALCRRYGDGCVWWCRAWARPVKNTVDQKFGSEWILTGAMVPLKYVACVCVCVCVSMFCGDKRITFATGDALLVSIC